MAVGCVEALVTGNFDVEVTAYDAARGAQPALCRKHHHESGKINGAVEITKDLHVRVS